MFLNHTEGEFEVECVCTCLTGAFFNYNSSCMSGTCSTPTDFHTSSHSHCNAIWVGGGDLQAHFGSNDVIGLVGPRGILIRTGRCSATANLRGVPHTELIMKL